MRSILKLLGLALHSDLKALQVRLDGIEYCNNVARVYARKCEADRMKVKRKA